ncbi:cytochrome c biogenesis protein CcsA [Fulvimonas sp. R45]|uniref:cytochrome C assembly family protein n=1 Tax=Fulvimonas sp. R45 TaxID=3045937 RepID=UPI00265D7BEA|nr:cytochrome c biogenesis protein CcsA [Fulvimonas sp. R45]MDO1528021.1 cytochrome c biogenesis protein CcsA [Fulvimonas sp. R45]
MSLALPAILSIVLYLASAALLAAPLTGCPRTPQRLGLGAATLAVLLHAAVLLGAHGGRVDLHFFAALSLVAGVVAALTLLVNLTRPVAGLGVIVFPLAALLLALDSFVAPPTRPLPLDWQITLHVAIALLAYSLLSIAAVLAILLAVQERALRAHRPGRLVRALPPLTQTEALLFRLIGAGFVGLTLTLLTGALFVQNIRGQHLAHTIVLSVVAWVIFGALLWGRWRHGWRGTRAVNLTLAGMAVLALAFFGSKFVLEMVLKRTP